MSCPINKTATGGNSNCKKEKCEWWHEYHDKCSIVVISDALDAIKNYLLTKGINK